MQQLMGGGKKNKHDQQGGGLGALGGLASSFLGGGSSSGHNSGSGHGGTSGAGAGAGGLVGALAGSLLGGGKKPSSGQQSQHQTGNYSGTQQGQHGQSGLMGNLGGMFGGHGQQVCLESVFIFLVLTLVTATRGKRVWLLSTWWPAGRILWSCTPYILSTKWCSELIPNAFSRTTFAGSTFLRPTTITTV
jgi:hypothetical protein